MSGINKVILVGRLGKDPTRRETRDRKEYSYFSMATSKKIKEEEITTWHNVTVWNEHNARYVNSYAQKGTMLYIEGELETRQYEKDGVTHYATDIVVGSYSGVVQILKDGVPRDEGNKQEARRAREPSYREGKAGEKDRAAEAPDWSKELDDEIPF